MADNDEEITLDFGKFASFFKGKPKGEQKVSEHEAAQGAEKAAAPKKEEHSGNEKEEPHSKLENKGQEEEISVDFSKLTSLFKPKANASSGQHEKHPAEKEKEEAAEVSLDFSKVKEFFGKIHPNFLVLLLVLIPLVLGVSIRFQTADLHVTDTWAKSTVYNYYQNAILDQISQQYPTLPDSRKAEMANTEFEKFLKEQASFVNPQISELSQRFKDEFKDNDGNNYLPDIDTYYWLRFIDNLDQKGHLGDEVIDGKQFDNHFLFPFGREVSEGEFFHIYLGYYFYRFIKLFDASILPIVAFAYLPVFLFALCSIFIFFITKRIAGSAGGFFAAMLLAVVPYFVTKSSAGYADTDIQVVFFPLLVAFLFLEAFEAKKLWKILVFGVLAGLSIGVFSFTWMGWWYIFDFLVGAAGLYLIYYLIINRSRLSEHSTRRAALWIFLPLAVFALSSAISVGLLTTPEGILSAVTGPLAFRGIKSVATVHIWPNVYTTVAEQNEVPLSQLIDNIGGIFLFVISILGIALTLTKRDRHGHIDIKYALLLAIWFLSTLYASTKGLRFILIIIPAFCVGFGVFAGLAIQHLSRYIGKELSIPKAYSTIILSVIFILVLIPSGINAYSIVTSTAPDISDAWVRSLEFIKTNSTPPAVINSWWDFGHWFKYWADTPVTFDGTSQNIPRAHWIGLALLTEDEDEAVSILRTLDCGADETALSRIDTLTNDSMKSVLLFKQLILLDEEGGEKLLTSAGFDSQAAKQIAAMSYCELPENYFITSGDMVQKSGVWAHFGIWNFTKSDMVLRVKPLGAEEGKKLLAERYGLPQTQLDKYYYEIQTQDPNNWIADWPSVASGLSSCTNTSDLVVCTDGLIFNLTSNEMYAESAAGRLYPSRYSFVDSKGKFRIIQKNTSLITASNGKPLGAAIIRKGDSYSTLLMSQELVGSMFVRLFYFQGAGLNHFDLSYSDRDVTGTEIYVWKVDWEAR